MSKQLTSKQQQCAALLRNGTRCSYRAKQEYGGYCGIHAKSSPNERDSNKKTTSHAEKVQRLLSIGTSLVVLTEKAITYLPDVVEVIVKASDILFVEQEEEKLKRWYKEYPHSLEPKFINMKSSPRSMLKTMRIHVQEQDWQNLTRILNYEFPEILCQGHVPDDLLKEIMSTRSDILEELRKHR